MRYILVITFMLLWNCIYADLGSSVVYKIEIETKGGEKIIGKFEAIGYEDYTFLGENGTNNYCNNEKIQLVLKKVSTKSQDAIVNLYKEIYYPTYGFISDEKGYLCQYHYGVLGVAIEDDLIELKYDNIKKVKFLSAERNRRSWLTSELKIVTEKQLSWLDQRMFNDFIVIFYPTNISMNGVILLNYDTDYDKQEFRILSSKIRELLEEGKLKRTQRANKEFGHNILIFINNTC